ncbi:MAG: hypothetical protein ACFFDN_09445 [Candidatus Hodarchaeota archaeon]
MEIDLLCNPKLVSKWAPQFWYASTSWKIISGKWEIGSCNKMFCLGETKLKSGENICLIGSSDWKNYIFQVKFKILKDSIKPPEGGVIFYSNFKNIRNYYSFHFCHYKNKIELIKRIKSVWSTIAAQEYVFETQKEYFIAISSISGSHQCRIDGINCLKVKDVDVSSGYIGIGSKYCDVEFSHASVSF